MVRPSQRKATDNYNLRNYSRMEIKIRKDGGSGVTLEEIDKAAAEANMTRPEFVLSAIMEKMGRPNLD